MQIKLIEHGNCFSFDLEPESIADAALIIRLKMNAKKEVRGVYASAHRDGHVSGALVIGKVRNERSGVK
jgi:hypothetical protein